MSTPSAAAELKKRLPALMLQDANRLRRRIDRVGKARDRQAATEAIAADVRAAEARIDKRRATVPEPDYPSELPVSQRKDDIAAAIRDNQVVIVAGETGSGKTTQLPKICLELGLGVYARIGHTQPRRLAARTVAERIASELDTDLGAAVGYKVRFTDRSDEDTLVKLMTDGILLAEIQNDRMLRGYDTLIIDEAHERSLNIDFILGYVKQLLPRRPDLKVIITSATIDPERFSRHFDDAPIVEVSGRTYPVELRYRPIVDDTDPDSIDKERDQTQAICDAVDELGAHSRGDVLVFLSGEREISDTADALAKQNLPDTEILPLYARLSAAEQQKVFAAHSGRRIVLATNVAETSLTVPGIKYVIDPGTARISRYSYRTKVQRLPIERISQASANQRKGRCGRTSDGICVRLYSEADFESRQEFTDPEIVRTNLASVILRMISLGLGEVAAFPFVDPPDRRQVSDGMRLLDELGALAQTNGTSAGRLTELGTKLAALPIDPRMARMVVESGASGCAHEVMVIASALSIQDPRERPADKHEAADAQHARFADKNSDFQSYLNLWEYLRQQQKSLSNNQFRKLCRSEFLNYLRIREWQDIYSQIRQLAKPLGITLNSNQADTGAVHSAVLSGLLSHVGFKDQSKDRSKGEYLGARGARFSVFPGSALFNKQPKWLVSAELVETSRLWARVNARIEPEWVEPLAAHLVKREYSEPHWERRRGAVVAYERVTLYGLPLVAGRKVNYAPIDPELCRELFIRHALVEGDWNTNHRFFRRNSELLEEVENLEHRARRRDILVDDEALFEFYDQRVGSEVVSARHFDTWWKKVRREQPDLLDFEKATLINESAAEVSTHDYPDAWHQGSLTFALTYQFEPGADADGVTAHIPLSLLNQVSVAGFEWQVPGLREELITALIKSLPKQLRRNFVPAPDTARAVLGRVDPAQGTLLDVLTAELRRQFGVSVPRQEWQFDAIADHLRITFRITDDTGATLAEGKDLDSLQQRLSGPLRQRISAAAGDVERTGVREPTFGELPKVFETGQGSNTVRAYPALVDEGNSVAVQMLDTPAGQRQQMWLGTRRLLRLNTPSPTKFVKGNLDNRAKLLLAANPHGSLDALLEDCVDCALDELIDESGGPVWDETSFGVLLEKVRGALNPTVLEVVNRVRRVLEAAGDVRARLGDTRGASLDESLADIRAHADGLVFAGFVTATGYRRLPDLPRYLRGIERRLEKLPSEPRRDVERLRELRWVEQEYRDTLDRHAQAGPPSAELSELRWMLEELRVSFFAQTLGTAYPISVKRVVRALDAVS